MANTTRPNISDAWVKKLEKYKANRIAEWYTWYKLDEVMDQAYQYVLNNEKREKEEEERDTADKEMTDKKLDSKDEKVISEYDKAHRFYMFKKAVTQAYKAITWNYPKNKDDYTFAKDMTDANPESASTIHDYLSWNNVSLNEVMRNLNLENATTKYNVPESDWSIFHEVTSAGRSWEEWSDKIADMLHADTVSAYDADAEGNFGGQFVKNLWSSAWNIIWDTVWMVANPFDSLKWFKDMIAWLWLYGSKALHDLVMWESTMEEFLAKAKPEWWWDLPNHALNAWVDPEEATATVDAMKDYLVQRYWSLEAVSNTFYEDPMWFVRDVKDALRWFTWVAKKAGGKAWAVLDKINDLDSKYNPATKIEQWAVKWLNKTIEWVTDTSLEDIKNMPKKTVEWWKEDLKDISWTLGENEKKILQDNPYAWEQLQSMLDEYKKVWETKNINQIIDQAKTKYIKEELIPSLQKIIWNVVDEWKAYWVIDKSWMKLDSKSFKNKFEEVLKENKLNLDKDWNIDFTKKHKLKDDAWVVNELYDKLKEIWDRWEDLDIWEYRDLRWWIWKKIKEVWKDSDTWRFLNTVRDKLNEEAHAQNSILAWVDEIYSKNRTKANQSLKWLVDSEWNIKDNAVSTKAKQTGKSSWIASEKQLEEILPSHKAKMEWFDIASNLLKKYSGSEKNIKRLQYAWQWLWHAAWLMLWWDAIWALVGWWAWKELATYLAKNLTKNRDINWNEAINNISDTWKKTLKAINDKIKNWWELTKSDKAKIDKLLEWIKS